MNVAGWPKDRIRARVLERRRALAPEDVRCWSQRIDAQVRAMPVWDRCPAILSYVDAKGNETPTRGLITAALAKGRQVLVPVVAPGRTLVWSEIHSLDELVPARFGIFEPRPDALRPTTPPPGALCLVPGIAFTRDGYRVGYGGGYYDRFLAGFDGTAIGLAFEAQVIEGFTPDVYDMPVERVVTEAVVSHGDG